MSQQGTSAVHGSEGDLLDVLLQVSDVTPFAHVL